MGQAELGDRIGELLDRPVSQDQIGHWETGRNLPRLDAMVALARVLGTSIDVMVVGEEGLAAKVEKLAGEVLRLREEVQRRPEGR